MPKLGVGEMPELRCSEPVPDRSGSIFGFVVQHQVESEARDMDVGPKGGCCTVKRVLQCQQLLTHRGVSTSPGTRAPSLATPPFQAASDVLWVAMTQCIYIINNRTHDKPCHMVSDAQSCSHALLIS